MTDNPNAVNVTDAEWAVSLTGCFPDDSTGYAFCDTHDEDGNPAWNECRWTRVAEALTQARNEGYDQAVTDRENNA